MSVLALGGVYLPNSPHPLAPAGDPYSTGVPAFISLLISLLISLFMSLLFHIIPQGHALPFPISPPTYLIIYCFTVLPVNFISIFVFIIPVTDLDGS